MTEQTKDGAALRLSIFDPTGNITALVESPVEPALRGAAAARIMARFPRVEQVGFVRFPEGEETVALAMAGGEFCGNASMSAAALGLLRRGEGGKGEWKTVALKVSGVSSPVEVRLRREGAADFAASVCMPDALAVEERRFSFGSVCSTLTLVHLEGITHAVVEPDSPFFPLRDNRSAAEAALRQLSAALGVKAAGLMFLDGEAPRRRLTPLVYVESGGTMFWENACASGSAAAALALAERAGEPLALELREPGGILRAESGGRGTETRLLGRTRLLGEETL